MSIFVSCDRYMNTPVIPATNDGFPSLLEHIIKLTHYCWREFQYIELELFFLLNSEMSEAWIR